MKQRFQLVPRKEGDPPIPEEIEKALRAQGIDTARFTIAPVPGGDLGAILAAMPGSGQRLRHTFRFTTLDAAFSAIERLIGNDMPVTITKAGDAWLIVFDIADDASVEDTIEHKAFAEKVIGLGGEDRGYIRETVTRRISDVTKT